MPRIEIHDVNDPRLDVYRELKETNYRQREGLFIAESRRVSQRLLESSFEVVSVLASDKKEGQIAADVPPEVPFYIVPHAMASELVGYRFHTGVLACGRRRESPRITDVFSESDEQALLVVCPNVNDPDNLGLLIRMSSAFGANAIVFGKGSCDPYSRRVLRVSMANGLSLPIVESDDLHADLTTLKERHKFTLAATVLDEAAEPLHQVQRPARLAILFGNEAHGLEPEWQQICQRRFTIPMQRGTDSLNVGMAAGIFLYALTFPG